jgi:hypothetical protein
MVRNGDCLYEAVMQNQPVRMAAAADYGLDGFGGTDPRKIYAAYQFAVRHLGVTAEQLNKACGDSKRLSELIGIEVKTVWDVI